MLGGAAPAVFGGCPGLSVSARYEVLELYGLTLPMHRALGVQQREAAVESAEEEEARDG